MIPGAPQSICHLSSVIGHLSFWGIGDFAETLGADVIPFCSALSPRRREVSKAEEFFAQNQVFPLDKIQEPQNALSRPIGRRFWNQGLSGFGGSGSERRREAGADD